MGRKNQVKAYPLIENGLLSDASITGNETFVAQTDKVELTVDWSGVQTTNGSLAIQATIDNVNWFDLDFGTTITLDGATGNHQLLIESVTFEKIRPVYTRTNAGATGNLTIKVFATSIGG